MGGLECWTRFVDVRRVRCSRPRSHRACVRRAPAMTTVQTGVNYAYLADELLLTCEREAQVREWHLDKQGIKDTKGHAVPGVSYFALRIGGDLIVSYLHNNITYRWRRASG